MRRACARRGVEIAHTGRACRVRAMAEGQDGRTWRWVIEHGHTDLKAAHTDPPARSHGWLRCHGEWLALDPADSMGQSPSTGGGAAVTSAADGAGRRLSGREHGTNERSSASGSNTRSISTEGKPVFPSTNQIAGFTNWFCKACSIIASMVRFLHDVSV
jgi:hypothetical protein